MSNDGIHREAKHNLFARQVYNEDLQTDLYLMTHLETPPKSVLPGTHRQRKWILYVCGWVSKERAQREGVYLPRGSLSEQRRTWIVYRGQEIEFYNRNLNGLAQLSDILKLDQSDVEYDRKRQGDLTVTSVDAVRIAYDLVGRGILTQQHLRFVQQRTGLEPRAIKPILHPNQYFHVLRWLKEQGQLTAAELEKLKQTLAEEPYSGI